MPEPVATRSRATLVFDGDCGFCTTSKDWILARLEPGTATATPFQWAELAALGLSREEAGARVWVVGDGLRLGGGRAAAWLLRRARGRGWRLLGALIDLPGVRWLTEAGYRLVAANRHRLPGGTPACALPR